MRATVTFAAKICDVSSRQKPQLHVVGPTATSTWRDLLHVQHSITLRITSVSPTYFLNINGSKSVLRVAGLFTVDHLDQPYHRWDGAHQPHQPAGESSCPQEAGWHPVDGVTEVSHAPEEREKLRSHLPVELRAAAGREHGFIPEESRCDAILL